MACWEEEQRKEVRWTQAPTRALVLTRVLAGGAVESGAKKYTELGSLDQIVF